MTGDHQLLGVIGEFEKATGEKVEGRAAEG
jgi:hypothetical protein